MTSHPDVPEKQDPKERRKIRHTLRRLIDDTQKRSHELADPNANADVDGLANQLKEADTVFGKIHHTREAAIDSVLIAQVSDLGRQRAQKLHTNLVVFQPAEFAKKLIRFVQNGDTLEENNNLSRDAWVKLGEAVQPFFNKAPPLHIMFGSFDRGPPVKKIRKERAAKDKEQEDPNAKTVPKQLKSFNDGPKSETTTEEVEKMLNRLNELYDQVNHSPICYYEFVLNPDSFGQTIENMFYASFLVKDGCARIFLDSDKLPVIEPVERDEGDVHKVQSLPRHQVIMSITVAEWEELKKTFRITKPLIPPRIDDKK